MAIGDKTTVSAVFADIDNDGDVDLIVGRDTVTNQLYINDGKGGFTEDVTSGLLNTKASYVYVFADFDSDGDMDAFCGYSLEGSGYRNTLFINEGVAQFVNDAESILETNSHQTVDCVFADVDNDGDLDLFLIQVFVLSGQLSTLGIMASAPAT